MLSEHLRAFWWALNQHFASLAQEDVARAEERHKEEMNRSEPASRDQLPNCD